MVDSRLVAAEYVATFHRAFGTFDRRGLTHTTIHMKGHGTFSYSFHMGAVLGTLQELYVYRCPMPSSKDP